MPAHIQWLKESDGEIGVFRAGEGFNEYGDPYELVCTVQRLSGGGLHMFGVQSNLREKLMRLLSNSHEALTANGVKYIIWERLKPDGTMREVKINLEDK